MSFFAHHKNVPTVNLVCPHCLKPADYMLPVEPVFDLKLAATLIPMDIRALRRWLQRRKAEFPGRYRKLNRLTRVRVLTASEIRTIRDCTVFEGSHDTRRRIPYTDHDDGKHRT